MELGLQTFLTCPHTTALLDSSDYCRFEIALSGYFSAHNDICDATKSEMNSKMIHDACRMAFRWMFFQNVNLNKCHLLGSLLKPMIGETYKHLWCYINIIHRLNSNYQRNALSQRITIFEIYVLLSFHFLQVNAEYVVQLLNINQYPSKLHDIIYILNQFLEKLTKIRSYYEETFTSNNANSASTKINVIYREYSVAHLLSILGDYETASISIRKISDQCKQHCLDNKDNNASTAESVIPLSHYFKQLYVYLLYNGCETCVERLYSNTYVSDDESDNAMMFTAVEYADSGIVQQAQWMNEKVDITHNVDGNIRKLIYEYIICHQQYVSCKLRVTKSRASALMAQTSGLNMLSAKCKEQLKQSYSDTFSTTERLLQNTISDLNALYNQLSDILQYIDGTMLLRNKYSNDEWSEWIRSHNFNSIKCVIKSTDNIITKTVDKLKQFMDQNKNNSSVSEENETNEEEQPQDTKVKEDGNNKHSGMLYEMRFKIQTLVSSVSILLIESNAVLGELLYCAASVNVRSMELILNKSSLELTDSSILKTLDAIEMFMDHYYSAHPFNDISLFLLIRMLKDLGKVCGFKRYALWTAPSSVVLEECQRLILQTSLHSTQYLRFAAIICENLIGKSHAVSKNISRLSKG